MIADFTLIILTYNRSVYLSRLLEYYEGSGLNILIADSSDEENVKVKQLSTNIQYYYFRSMPLNQKINEILRKVQTKYSAFCGDDDFMAITGLEQCISFLKENPDFSVAHGYRIMYAKDFLKYGKIYFQLLFDKSLNFSVIDEDPLRRIEIFFSHYKSIFYGVHVTENLVLAFKDLYTISTNNYLNEYVTGIVPLAAGKYKEINCLYCILEGSSVSDGNFAHDLRKLYNTEEGKTTISNYIKLQARAISQRLNYDINLVTEKLDKALHFFVEKLNSDYSSSRKMSTKKSIGTLLLKTGFIGRFLVNVNRRLEVKQAVSNLPFSKPQELEEIKRVSLLITKYGFIK